MKKEVIYFDGVAYGPFAKCELTNGYLESFYMNMDEEASGESKKIKKYRSNYEMLLFDILRCQRILLLDLVYLIDHINH